MTDLAYQLLRHETAAFVIHVVAQCTVVLAIALLAARLLKHNAIARDTILKSAVVCTLVCPLTAAGLHMAGVTLIEIPVVSVPLTRGSGDLTRGDRETQETRPSAPPCVAIAPASVRVESAPPAAVDSAAPSADSANPMNLALDYGHEDHGRKKHDLEDQAASLKISSQSSASAAIPPDAISSNATQRIVSAALTAWMFGVCLLAWGIARSWWKLKGRLRNVQPVESETLRDVVCRLQIEYPLKRFPQIVSSSAVKSPITVGILRPRIVLPTGLCEQLEAEQVRAILLHELAHVMRRDLLLLLCEHLLGAIFWPHPLVHMLRRQLARTREEVCDNYVLQTVDGPSYGELLLRLARLAPQASPIPCGVGLFSSRWKLEERISGLLDKRRKTMVRMNWMGCVAIAMATFLVVGVIGTTNVVAQQDSVQTDLPPTELPPPDNTTARNRVAPPPTVATPPTAAASADRKNRVVAYVNDEKIFYDDVVQVLIERHARDKIDVLVKSMILEQACREKNITISEADVTAEVERTARKYGLSAVEWYGMLEKVRDLSVSSYHREVIRPQLMLKQLAGEQDLSQFFDELESRAKVVVLEEPAIAESEGYQSLPTAGTTEGPAGKQSRRIAVVDVGRIFQSSERFKQRLEGLKSDIEQCEQRIKDHVSEIKQLQDAAQAINDNPTARSILEKLIADKSRELEQARKVMQKEFRGRESQCYLDAYRLILDEIKQYADENHIDLVLRDEGDQRTSIQESTDLADINPADSNAVQRKLNEDVLFVRDGNAKYLEITDDIIKRLKPNGAKPSPWTPNSIQ